MATLRIACPHRHHGGQCPDTEVVVSFRRRTTTMGYAAKHAAEAVGLDPELPCDGQ